MKKGLRDLAGIFFFWIALQSFPSGVAAQDSIVAAPQNIFADSGYFSSFDSTKIYYEVHGSGFPVLLVHGFIVNSSSWKHTALYDSLLAAGNKVILIDLRGNGKSGKPHTDDAYKYDAETKDIILLLKYLNIHAYDVIGYSRGSIITARLLVWDKRVHKAVLGGMGADFTNPNWPRRIQFYQALTYDNVAELHSMVEYVKQSGLDQQALALLQKYQPSTPTAVLAKIKNHVLVIHGDSDMANGSAEELAAIFPHGEIAVTPGDHNHALQTPEFAAVVMQFLKKPEE
jgi:pimeloyl-ACP methyl ester carboxylesterase